MLLIACSALFPQPAFLDISSLGMALPQWVVITHINTIQENVLQTLLQTNFMEIYSQLRVPLPRWLSKLGQADIKQSSTGGNDVNTVLIYYI